MKRLAELRTEEEQKLPIILEALHIDVPAEQALPYFQDLASAYEKGRMCQICPHNDLEKSRSCFQLHAGYDKEAGFSFRVSPCPYTKKLAAQRHYEDTFRSMMIAKRFQNRTFENFHPDAATENAYKYMQRWTVNYEENARGVFLFGQFGTGKTHLAVASLIEIFQSHGIAGAFVAFPDFLAKLKSQFGSEKELAKTFDTYADAPVLVIDDLSEGRTKPDGQLTPWVSDQLFRLINHRYEYDLTTIITAAYAPDVLMRVVGTAVFSRIAEMCSFVHVKGGNYRARHIEIIE